MSTKKQTADTATLEWASEIDANSLFETGAFSTKNGEIEAHFLFETGAFSTKTGEIEAHSSFETGAFSTKIGEIDAHSLFQTGASSTTISRIRAIEAYFFFEKGAIPRFHQRRCSRDRLLPKVTHGHASLLQTLLQKDDLFQEKRSIMFYHKTD